MTIAPRPPELTNILVVDDEAMVRQLIHRILNEQGYTLHQAVDGEEAMHFASQWPGPLHLLITDFLLPKISGSDLAQHVCAQHQETKVLFLSGYSEDLIIAREILGPRSAFLQKPFGPTLLLGKVRGLLASAEESIRRSPDA